MKYILLTNPYGDNENYSEPKRLMTPFAFRQYVADSVARIFNNDDYSWFPGLTKHIYIAEVDSQEEMDYPDEIYFTTRKIENNYAASQNYASDDAIRDLRNYASVNEALFDLLIYINDTEYTLNEAFKKLTEACV